MSNNWKVYKLTSPNGRSYVGCTKLPLWQRWENGCNYKHNKELYADIVQYGWINFTKEVLWEGEDETIAREQEHDRIKQFPDGYNIYRGQKEPTRSPNDKTPPKPVICVETGIIYNSIYHAAKENNLAKNKISYCCRGIRKKTGGYHWKFV